MAQTPSESQPPRRTGDRIAIDGAYQYRALTEGHPVQRFWHVSKQWVIGEFLPPAAHEFVVDVGCGSGVITHFLSGYGAEAVGVDGNSDAIKFARAQFPGDRLAFVEGYVDADRTFPRAVDRIYCLEVIEHLYPEQGAAMLRAFYRLLKPGGTVLLTTPNYRSLWPLIEWGLDRFSDAAHMDQDQHVCRYTPARLRAVCEGAGFTVERLSTWCLVAPWLAPVSGRLARAVHNLETRLPIPAGAVMLVVLSKPA